MKLSLILNSLQSHRGRISNGILAAVSIALAHYAGFVFNLPLQILAASGRSLAPGVTATFLFYVGLCAVVARVGIGILQPILLLQLLTTDRVEHGIELSNIRKKRKYVRSYHQLLKNEGSVWLVCQAILFTTLILWLYIDFTLTWTSGLSVLTALLLIVITGLFRSKFLLMPRWVVFKKRLKNSSSSQANVASAAFVTITSALVVTSFLMGHMRMELLVKSAPQQITNDYFSGYAKLIANSGSSTLLLEENDGNYRYIYVTSEYALTVESKPKSFPALEKQ